MSTEFDDSHESATERDERLVRAIEKRRARGEPFSPVICQVARGMPAKSFWGKAWCENLESYSDYEYRLPGGRSYLRKGRVYDLEIGSGHLFAYVTGGEIYEVEISISATGDDKWEALKRALAGEITNVVALLSGELPASVMTAVTDRESGLFPNPRQISFNCTCPDHADLCKHAAAVMYAAGIQFDDSPELLFRLRGVDHRELAQNAQCGLDLEPTDPGARVLAPDGLAELFGIDIADPDAAFEGRR